MEQGNNERYMYVETPEDRVLTVLGALAGREVGSQDLARLREGLESLPQDSDEYKIITTTVEAEGEQAQMRVEAFTTEAPLHALAARCVRIATMNGLDGVRSFLSQPQAVRSFETPVA